MSAKSEFNKVSTRQKREAPFSLRLSFEERRKLEQAAKGMPLSAFIKALLFGNDPPKPRGRRKPPVQDHEALGRVLSALGRSRLASNLNQLARAVNTGTLPVHPETEAELRQACAEVAAIRAALFKALGYEGGPS